MFQENWQMWRNSVRVAKLYVSFRRTTPPDYVVEPSGTSKDE